MTTTPTDGCGNSYTTNEERGRGPGIGAQNTRSDTCREFRVSGARESGAVCGKIWRLQIGAPERTRVGTDKNAKGPRQSADPGNQGPQHAQDSTPGIRVSGAQLPDATCAGFGARGSARPMGQQEAPTITGPARLARSRGVRSDRG